jgi:hypothetical protein
VAQRISDFTEFSEPESNYTKVPNDFFDKVMPVLSPYEAQLFLDIIRKTWGWQKRFERIAISQFVTRLGISKNTVLKGLAALEKHGCILRYRTGRGSAQSTHYFVNTPLNERVRRALVEGHITIEQAQVMNTTCPHLGANGAPSGGTRSGAPPAPTNGAPPAPTTLVGLGAPHAPSKRTRRKKRVKQEVDPRVQEPVDPEGADAAERVRELGLTRRRLAEMAAGQVTRIRDLVDRFRSPKEA